MTDHRYCKNCKHCIFRLETAIPWECGAVVDEVSGGPAEIYYARLFVCKGLSWEARPLPLASEQGNPSPIAAQKEKPPP